MTPDRDDTDRLAGYVAVWDRACTDFLALARELTPEEAALPTDLPGWAVQDNVAHTAHLEHVLAGGDEEPDDAPAEPASAIATRYTEQGVAARRGRDLASLCDELEAAVGVRRDELAAAPPRDARASTLRKPGGIGWDDQTLLVNRPIDVWMHEQDIRRAVGRPGGWDSPAAAHTVGVFLRALPMVVAKRAGAQPGQTVVLALPEAGVRTAVTVGDDGRAAPSDGAEPTVTISMPVEAFVVAAGGRRAPHDVEIDGDEDLGRRVVEALAVTP